MKHHEKQAQQLYKALLHRGQTWSRNGNTIAEWADTFKELESDIGSRKRIQRCLDWYCNEGCGALYVPLFGTADAFAQKFEQLDKARKRLKGQTLYYFDDLIAYQLQPRSGSKAQRQYAECIQKMQQRIEYVDSLANGRAKLPKASSNGKVSTGLTKSEKARLAGLCIVARDHLFDLLLQNPEREKELHRRLEKAGVNKRIATYANKLAVEAER